MVFVFYIVSTIFYCILTLRNVKTSINERKCHVRLTVKRNCMRQIVCVCYSRWLQTRYVRSHWNWISLLCLAQYTTNARMCYLCSSEHFPYQDVLLLFSNFAENTIIRLRGKILLKKCLCNYKSGNTISL